MRLRNVSKQSSNICSVRNAAGNVRNVSASRKKCERCGMWSIIRGLSNYAERGQCVCKSMRSHSRIISGRRTKMSQRLDAQLSGASRQVCSAVVRQRPAMATFICQPLRDRRVYYSFSCCPTGCSSVSPWQY